MQLRSLVCANSTNQIKTKLCPTTRPILQHIIISKPSLKIPSRCCKLLQAIAGRDSNENKRKYVHRAGIVLHTWRFHCIVSRIHYTKVPYVSRKKTIVDRLSSPPSDWNFLGPVPQHRPIPRGILRVPRWFIRFHVDLCFTPASASNSHGNTSKLRKRGCIRRIESRDSLFVREIDSFTRQREVEKQVLTMRTREGMQEIMVDHGAAVPADHANPPPGMINGFITALHRALYLIGSRTCAYILS